MVKYRYHDSEDGQIHYAEEGQGRKLILFHNIARSHLVFKRLMPLLADQFHVIAVDMPGFGASTTPRYDYSVPNVSRHVMRFMDDLPGDEPFVLYGHRFGGIVAADIAATNGAIVDVLAMSDFPYFVSDDERQEWMRRASVEASGGPSGLPSLLAEQDGSHLIRLWHRGFRRWWWGSGGLGPMDELDPDALRFIDEYVMDTMRAGRLAQEAFHAAFHYDSDARLPLVEVPALVLHGTTGFEIPPCQRSEEVSALMRDASMELVEGDAYLMHFQAEQVAKLLRRFVTERSRV